MKIFNAVWESSRLALNLVPLDEAGGAEFARDIINWMRDSLAASANYFSTGFASSPYTAAVGLFNRFVAWWNIQSKVLAERNAIRLADEYLTLYYRNGSDAAKVASTFGLSRTATLEEVLKSIAKQLGMTGVDDRICSPQSSFAICSAPQQIREDYNLKKASQWVMSFKLAVSNAANVCLQSSTCTNSQASLTTEQKPISETLNKQSDKLKINKTSSSTNSRTKKDSGAVCSKNSNVSSTNAGGAQAALSKFGSGNDGCEQ